MSHTFALLCLLALAWFAGWLTGRRNARDLVAALSDALLLDPLTGLPNRAAATAALTHEMAGSGPLCVGFADLDGFKHINDTHGHAVGDEAIKHLAEVASTTSPVTFIARIHGDEFVIIWRTDLDTALAEAARLHEVVASTPLLLPDNTTVPMSMSIGVADRANATNQSLLLHQAELAMYQAKTRPHGVASHDPHHTPVTAVIPRPRSRVRDDRTIGRTA